MVDITFGERIKTIFDLILSQSFFITLFFIVIATLVILIINIKVKSKAPKIAAAIVYIGLVILVLIRYGNYVAALNDNIIEKVFKAVYFPNFVVYVCMLLLSICLILVTFIYKKFSIIAKIGNTSCFILIWFFFVLLLDTLKMAGVNFHELSEVYSNKTVMILLQSSMFVFVTWLAIFVLDIIIGKLSNKMEDGKAEIDMNNQNFNL